ncbi:MAG: hypothetical protein ACE5F6_10545 [Anaerolineae bacterium]
MQLEGGSDTVTLGEANVRAPAGTDFSYGVVRLSIVEVGEHGLHIAIVVRRVLAIASDTFAVAIPVSKEP